MSTGQKERPPHWMVALVPLFGDVRVGGKLRPRWREASLIVEDATADERKRLYEALLEMKWLPPKARNAFLQALGFTRRKQKSDDETRQMMRLQHRIKLAPYKEIAASEGITVAALKKQLQRFRKRERRSKQEIARLKKQIARLKQESGKNRETHPVP
jgi:hypothetical protein